MRTPTKILSASVSGGLSYLGTPTDKIDDSIGDFSEIHRQVEQRRSAPSSTESSLRRSVNHTPSGQDDSSNYHTAEESQLKSQNLQDSQLESPGDEQKFHVTMRNKTNTVSTPVNSNSPTSPDKSAKRKSFMQRLFHLGSSSDGTTTGGAKKSDDFVFVSPTTSTPQSTQINAVSNPVASPSPTSPDISLPVSFTSESSKEQSLLSKIGRKVKQRKSKESSPIPVVITPPNKKLSPPKKLTMEVVDGASALKSKMKGGGDDPLIAPKATGKLVLHLNWVLR